MFFSLGWYNPQQMTESAPVTLNDICFKPEDLRMVRRIGRGGEEKSDLRGVMSGARVSEDDLQDFLKRYSRYAVRDNVLVDTEISPYRKAVLLSQTTAKDFAGAPDTAKKPNLRIDQEHKIMLLSPSGWFLCSSSEQRLRASVQNGAVVYVNPGLLVKFMGRLTALCIDSFSTQNGTFVAGNWYSPVGETRTVLETSFDNGFVKPEVKTGEWSLMRSLKDARASEDVLDSSRSEVDLLPEVGPETINGISRKFFRQKNREDFHS